jgi:hypothetical protein
MRTTRISNGSWIAYSAESRDTRILTLAQAVAYSGASDTTLMKLIREDIVTPSSRAASSALNGPCRGSLASGCLHLGIRFLPRSELFRRIEVCGSYWF